MLESILLMLPTVLAILGLAMFNEKTRWFCYTLVLLSVASELIPITINAVALAATSATLVALIGLDVAHRVKAPKASFVKH